MNYLNSVIQLQNSYYVQRHGESLANSMGIITSDAKTSHTNYGLTEKGVIRVRESVTDAKEKYGLNSDTKIWTSDFLRAHMTAQIAQEILGVPNIHSSILLRERFFGEFDMTSNTNYTKIWEKDEQNANHSFAGVESVSAVLQRITSLILELEDRYKNDSILLISHGDTLQILQTAFEQKRPTLHRVLSPLQTGEIRKLVFNKI